MREDNLTLWSHFPVAQSLSFLPLLFLQCLILHPSISPKHFEKGQLALRITPLLILQSVLSQDGFTPKETMQVPNFIWVMMKLYGLLKSIEWAFVKNRSAYDWIGFDITPSKPSKQNISSSFSSLSSSNPSSPPNLGRVILDQLHLFTSIRGLGYVFGKHAAKPRSRMSSTRFLIWTLIRVICWHISLCATAGILANPNSLHHYFPTAFSNDAISFGPLSQGIIWGVFLMTLFALSSQILLFNSCLVINLFHQLDVCGPFDSREHVPFFDRPLVPRNISEFWGKQWHAIYRRSFIFLGYQPGIEMGCALGMNKQSQSALGIMGAFVVTGVLHESALWSVAREVQQLDHRVGIEKLYVSLFFLSTALLIIIEQYFPSLKSRGVLNFLWKLLYLPLLRLVSLTSLKVELNHFPPLEQWDWQRFWIPLACFVPGKLWTK